MATITTSPNQAAMSQVGNDVDKAAKKRGRAYQCLRCYHREGKNFIEVKCRVEAHILRDHLRRDEVPFFCSLCQFRCLKREELDEHVRRYKRHRVVAQQSGVDPEDTSCLKVTSNPYRIGPKDYLVLDKEESYQHWRELLISRRRINDPWSQIALPSFDEVDFLDQYERLQEPPPQTAESSQTLVSLNRDDLWQTVAPLLGQLNDIDPALSDLLQEGTVKKGDEEETKEQENEQEKDEDTEPGKVDSSKDKLGSEKLMQPETEGIASGDTEQGPANEIQCGDTQMQEENIMEQLLPAEDLDLGNKRKRTGMIIPNKRMRSRSPSSVSSENGSSSSDSSSDDEEPPKSKRWFREEVKSVRAAVENNTRALRSLEQSILTLASAMTAAAKATKDKQDVHVSEEKAGPIENEGRQRKEGDKHNRRSSHERRTESEKGSRRNNTSNRRDERRHSRNHYSDRRRDRRVDDGQSNNHHHTLRW